MSQFGNELICQFANLSMSSLSNCLIDKLSNWQIITFKTN